LELLSVFLTSEAWITLVILVFLELVLGIDNLVFIALTTDRLPENKKRLGRRFGLLAALLTRIIFLCFASWIVSMTKPLFHLPFESSIFDLGFSGRDLILLAGGVFLIYKGITSIKDKLSLREEKETHGHPDIHRHPELRTTKIGLLQAIATIAVMDIVFSIDSVITAVGLAGTMLLVMILAVMLAVFVMIVLADAISEFINSNPQITLLALVFIILVGVKLLIESLGVELYIGNSDVSALNLALYVTLAVSFILTVLQMAYARRVTRMHKEISEHKAEQDVKASEHPGSSEAAE